MATSSIVHILGNVPVIPASLTHSLDHFNGILLGRAPRAYDDHIASVVDAWARRNGASSTQTKFARWRTRHTDVRWGTFTPGKYASQWVYANVSVIHMLVKRCADNSVDPALWEQALTNVMKAIWSYGSYRSSATLHMPRLGCSADASVWERDILPVIERVQVMYPTPIYVYTLAEECGRFPDETYMKIVNGALKPIGRHERFGAATFPGDLPSEPVDRTHTDATTAMAENHT